MISSCAGGGLSNVDSAIIRLRDDGRPIVWGTVGSPYDGGFLVDADEDYEEVGGHGSDIAVDRRS
jgi:hypothetical protein